MSQDKDEILAMAREAGAVFDPHWGIASNVGTATFQRFYTLCRAPLAAENAALKQAHEINADTLNAMQVEIDDWKARALKSEQAGEPVAYIAWKNDKPCYEGDDAICEDAVWPVDSDDYRTSMPVFTAPQPAAQELDCATTGVCVRSGLYASPPSAPPVVEPDMFWNHDDAEKLYHGIGEFLNDEICNGSLEAGDIRVVQQAKRLPNVTIRVTSINDDECDADWEVIDAIAAGQKFIKESGK